MAGMGSFSLSKTEQIIAEFFVKCLHTILEARIPSPASQLGRDSPSPASSSSSSSRDRWFNLILADCPCAQESAEPWRRNPSDPMVVDILLARLSGDPRLRGSSPDSWSEGEAEDSSPGTVLERWTVSYDKLAQPRRANTPQPHALEVPGIYKRAVIFMRTLYCWLRSLPAHRLFHLASSSSQSRSFSLGFKVWSSPPPPLADEAAMELRSFAPVETPGGRLAVSVAYRHTTAVTALEVTPSILPRIIADYVGSPTTDPLRRLSAESFSGSLSSGGIAGRRGVHVVSVPTSVASSPSGIARRNSWGGALNKLQPPTLLPPSSPSFGSGSPSPHHSPVTGSSRTGKHSQPIAIEQQRPRFSPPNPSPPGTCHSLESSLARYLPRHATAPVSIPKPSSLRGMMPDRSALPPQTPKRSFEQPHHNASSNLSGARGGTGEGGSLRLSASTLAESMLLISPPHPFHPPSQGDDGPPFGIKRSLYGSPRISLSRSSSKIHDTDEEEFACPFVVDEDDEDLNPHMRTGSPRARYHNVFEASGPKSQHAAVGALVRLLKSAPPLQGRSSTGAGAALDVATDVSPQQRSKSRPIPGALQHPYQTAGKYIQQHQQQQQIKSFKTALKELEEYKDLRRFIVTEGIVQATNQRE